MNRLMQSNKKRRWLAVGITIAIAGPLTLWGIYGIGEYGMALFILTPIFIGACATTIYGYKTEVTFKQSLNIGMLTLGVFGAGLLLCAIEGGICILMASPFALALSLAGSAFAHTFILKQKPAASGTTLFLLLISIPLTSFIEKDSEPELLSVVTSVEINANPEIVWKNVIAFPKLEQPEELLFKAGIAYPTEAVIEGTGPGAVRYCKFNTGDFIEPVTSWKENDLLAFDVQQQPVPMRELNFWNIDAPHLHDYFVSRKGQFKLTKIAEGKTLLEGTTWYTNKIAPQFYWRLWSDFIVHKIHERVLQHIKRNCESATVSD